MASDWIKTTLDDVCIKITDGAHKSPKSVDSGKPMASVKDLEFYGLNLETARHISEEDYDDLVKQGCKPELGDVLIAKDGNSALDTVCTFEKDAEVVLLSSVAMLRPNPEKINSRFLKYYFLSSRTIEYLKRNFISGAAIPRVVLRDFKKAEIQLPLLPEQKAIAHILGSLDDKIELNRQMNETLEAMAQALFKSWFVDFDPVIDNALAAGNAIPDEFAGRAEQRQAVEKTDNSDIHQLFPDEFEFTEEMGWIPKGWGVGSIADVSFVKGGYAFKGKDFGDKGFPVIKIKNINNDRTVNISDVQFIPNDIAKKAQSFWIKTGDLIMAMTGATVGKFGLLVTESENIYLLNQRVAKFNPISSSGDKIWFIYCFLNQKSTIDYIVNIAEGSAQPNISADSIMATQLVKPSDELINVFNDTMDIVT